MSQGDKTFHFSPSGLPDAADYQLAVDLWLKDWKIVTGVDIPYCCGYSVDGKTIYMDREVPEFADLNGRKLPIWRGGGFVHEATEKTMLLRYTNEHYQGAHTIATLAEHAYVQSKGARVDDYDGWWAPIIAKIGKRKSYPNVPADLDLAPYEDSDDQKILARMTFADVGK